MRKKFQNGVQISFVYNSLKKFDFDNEPGDRSADDS